MSEASKTRNATVVCWDCGGQTDGGHFCAICGRIQPLPASADYFAFFDLPPRLHLDAAALEEKFLQLSWKLHPDNFVNASENERDLSLERTSQLNDAFRTLRDPIARVEYLLAQQRARAEGTAKQQAPPELLEEVFELNESLDDLRSARASGADVAGLRQNLLAAQQTFLGKLQEVDADLDSAFSDWDSLLEPANGNGAAVEEKKKQVVNRMNELLNRRSYIRNLVNTVQSELAQD